MFPTLFLRLTMSLLKSRVMLARTGAVMGSKSQPVVLTTSLRTRTLALTARAVQMLAAVMATLHRESEGQRLAALTAVVMALLQVPTCSSQTALMAVATTFLLPLKRQNQTAPTAVATMTLQPP
jgi:hypothetical protein